MTSDDSDDGIRHTSGPHVDADGLISGQIELPGGLPPEDDDEDEDGARLDIPRWDEAWSIADRDGYVLFDPDTPGGFRALTPDERAELTDAVRASTPPEVTGRGATADVEDAAGGYGRADPRVTADGTPWVDSPGGIAERERWAIENADPAKARDDSHPDDLDALQRRLDELRVRLTGYTWREGVDRDEALADRRAQLGRWYDDDRPSEDTDSSDDGQADGLDPYCLPQCIVHVDDPRDPS
jgi:hypothetical protein